MRHSRYHTLGLNQRERTKYSWALPALGLIITSTIVIALLVLNAQEWRSSEKMVISVLERRSTIAIGVQIIAHILGGIQVQVLCNVIASSFRVALPLRPFSFDTIRFFGAISRPGVAWEARWLFNIASVLFVVASLIPGAMWSGAITPIFEEKIENRTIQIPTFQSQNLSAMWDPGNTTATKANGFFPVDVWITNNGLFTFEPAISSIRGNFLGLASTASNTTGPDSLRPKFDHTGYHHFNRSFGVGAAAGLISVPDTINPTWYSFPEVGFVSNASCMYNASSAFDIRYLTQHDKNFDLRFQANGTFANGMKVIPEFRQITPQRHDIFIWSVAYAAAEKKTYISIAVDTTLPTDPYDFNQFDKVQCEINYEPTNFVVQLNVTAKTMIATKSNDLAVPWPDYGDKVLSSLDSFRRYSSDESMVYGSHLGHTIVVNINQLRMMKNQSDSTDDKNNATMLQGLEEYLESLYDNGIGMLSATRLIGANKTTPVDATVGVPAIKYGQPIYLYAVLAIQIVVLIAFVVEAIRTRGWAYMASLELSDVASVMLAASNGGTALSEKVNQTSPGKIGHTKLRLRKTAGGWEALTLQESASDGRFDLNDRKRGRVIDEA
ncbi:hypothetical protein DM02DRAFT_568170 [Periconia macrospinosa]|uniref:Uncharacterized protein n=1 Tax=Periconia macrospinosa TaxID=97972 RepID=A0A2V1DGP6_9PLEO|nr:hypothetical protein DM02DRAFT_568170 [Periconia macrospinosa]